MERDHDPYTPGPWTVRPGRPVVVRAPNAGYFIAETFDHRKSPANARLIAAAPDILEALEDLLEQLATAGTNVETERALAAVQRALGPM